MPSKDSLYNSRQKKIEESSPLGRNVPEDIGLPVSEMIKLTTAIENILKLNNLFEELGEDDYFLYLILMEYAQKEFLFLSENNKENNKEIMLKDAFRGMVSFHKTKLEANRDPLTNIWTRRALGSRFTAVKKIIDNSKESRSPKSAFLCYIDADNFKQINETYGHNAGDQILIKLAELMDEHTKSETDFSARIGGDEFAILLVFPKAEIEVVKKRIIDIHKEIIENLHITTNDGKKVSLKISIGVTQITAETANLEEATKLADKNLEAAKHDKGKGIVVFEDSPETPPPPSLVQKTLALLKKIFN